MISISYDRLLGLGALLLAAVGAPSCCKCNDNLELGDEQRGEVTVDENDTVLRFHVRSTWAAAIRVEATAFIPAAERLDPPVEVRVSPDVAYTQSTAPDAGGTGVFYVGDDTTSRFDLAGAPCRSGCEQDVELHFQRHAPGQPPLRVRWVLKAGLEVIGVNDDQKGDYSVTITRGS